MNNTLLTLPFAAAVLATAAQAQYRDAMPPVIEPAPAAAMPAPSDVAPRFAEAYARAGHPRTVLLWNRAVGDQAQTQYMDKQVAREQTRTSDNALDKTTEGSTDSAKLREAGHERDHTRTVTSGRVAVADEPVRTSRLPERFAAMIENAFVAEMSRGGMRFVDRTLAIRTTAATRHRHGADPRLIEADALMARGDLLLEVLLVEDKDAPGGHGFDVKAKRLKDGRLIGALYSQGLPPPPPLRAESRWVPAANGYVLQTPPTAPPPTPAQIGAALARDVMKALSRGMAS